MNLTDEERNTIERISIRGRMALALVGLERLIDRLGTRNPTVDALLAELWRYVEKEWLAGWDQEVRRGQSLAGSVIDTLDGIEQRPFLCLWPQLG